MYYVAPETPMMSSVVADCPDLALPNILNKCAPMHETHEREGKNLGFLKKKLGF